MAQIYATFWDVSWLTVAVIVRDKADGSLDFSGNMTNLAWWLYFFQFTEVAWKEYVWQAFAEGWTVASWELVDTSASSGWLTPEQIYTYFTTDNREYAFKWVWWGWIIDTTKKHEEIIEKYEKLMKEELKKIVDSIPKADISSVLTAISQIPKVNLDDMTLALSAFKWQIKILNTTIKNDYISERNRIEIEYAKEIDKKNSLLSENEYNLKQKEEKIESLTESVESLSKTIEKMNEEHEEEMKMMDEWYSEELKKADDESEEKMAEKFLSLIES